jgi:hypothetical protein
VVHLVYGVPRKTRIRGGLDGGRSRQDLLHCKRERERRGHNRIVSHVALASQSAVTTALGTSHCMRACTHSRPRTSWIRKLPAGVSQLTRDILHRIFVAEGASVTLKLGDQVIRLKLVLKSIIADEEALNAMFWTTGASGLTPCGMLCSVYSKATAADIELGIDVAVLGDVADISCNDLKRCGERSDEDVYAICDILERAPKEVLAKQESLYGIKCNKHALLFCRPLRQHVLPSTVATGDPMHILFSGGLLGGEIMLWLAELRREVGAGMADVRQYHVEAGWLPGTAVHLAFSEKREKSSHITWKAQASELLSAYPLLRAFILEAFGANAAEPYVKSMLLLMELCDKVRILLCSPGLAHVDALAKEVESLAKRYLTAFVEAHGSAAVRFKHHQLLHLGEQILRLRRMLSCWVTERKNKSAKLALQHTTHVSAIMHATGLSRMLADQIRRLGEPGWRSCLIGKSNAFAEMAQELGAASVHIAPRVKLNGMLLSHGDVLFADLTHDYLIVVVACLAIDTSFGLLVRRGCRAESSGSASSSTDSGARASNPWASTWQVDPEVALLRPTAEQRFMKVAFHRYLSSDRLEVLH